MFWCRAFRECRLERVTRDMAIRILLIDPEDGGIVIPHSSGK